MTPKTLRAQPIPHPTIECTKDYDAFDTQMNRNVNPKQVEKLARSMAERGYLQSYPIIITSGMVVRDGQHRLAAAKQAGVPVYYVVDDTIDVPTVAAVNRLVSKWGSYDYLTYCAKQGDESAGWLVGVIAREGAPRSGVCSVVRMYMGMSAVGGERNDVLTPEMRTTIEQWVRQWHDITAVGQKEIKQQQTFFVACCRIFNNPQYSHKQMMDRLSWQSTRLVKCPSGAHYVELLNDIYNRNSREGNKVDLRLKPRHGGPNINRWAT